LSKKVVVVEGIIGAGKTSLSRELGAALGSDTLTLLEPDEKGNANPYLADFCADPARWALTMQVHLLQRRFRMHLSAQWHAMEGRGHAILDRSYFGDTAFARLQRTRGAMSNREFETYSGIYHGMTAHVLLPQVCVRVLCAPAVAAERVRRRMEHETGRKCEEKIVDVEYLADLDREIDYMVGVLRDQGVAVLDVPWDADRDSTLVREQTVRGLAARIDGLVPRDAFLDMHRRTV